jgi:hypothetical protein
MRFAVWFDSTTLVNTTNDPDATVSYVDGHGDYHLKYRQTESLYAAIAAITDDQTRPNAEIHLSWSATRLSHRQTRLLYRPLVNIFR